MTLQQTVHLVDDDRTLLDAVEPVLRAEPSRLPVAETASDSTGTADLEAERLARIIEIQQAIAAASLDIEQLIESVLQGAQSLTRAEGVSLVMRGGIDVPLLSATASGPARAAAAHGAEEPSLLGECLRTGRVLRCDDTESDPRIDSTASRASNTRSMIYMPVIDRGEAIGVVAVLSSRPNAFTDRDEQSLTLVAGLLSAALARAAAIDINQALVAERTAALDALRASEERYRRQTLTFATINEAVIVVDRSGRILEWNFAAERILAYSHDEVIRRRPTFIIGDRAVRRTVIAAFASGERWAGDLRCRRPDGGERLCETTIVPLQDDEGAVTCTIIVCRDVTSSRQLEHQLLQAQKLEAIGQLTAGIAHEINTPAQYVGDNLRFVDSVVHDLLGVLDALERVAAECRAHGVCESSVSVATALAARADTKFIAEELPSAVRHALEGTDRIAQIVRGMRPFAQPTTAGLGGIDLNEHLEAAINITRSEWSYVADVVRDFDPSMPLVVCRAGEIDQMLLNIVVNAAQAIAAKQAAVRDDRPEKGTITIGSRVREEIVELWIADSGEGIAPEVSSRIYDPFFTTRPVGRGTGQGLAVAHSIIERHRGRISFTSEVGIGTTFVIRLPIAGPPGSRA